MPLTSTTGLSLVASVSNTLADQCDGQEYTTWSRAVLAGYLREGLCQILALRPDAFSEIATLTLSPGSTQTIPDEYEAILNIEGTTATGDPATSGINPADYEVLRFHRKQPCLADTAIAGQYTPSSFTQNPNVKSSYTVFPPVPDGDAPTVQASVVRRPTDFTDANLDETIGVSCEYDAPLVDWMLMRAYGTEHESAGSANLAVMHRDTFYSMFNINYRQAQRVGSGFYLGREGDGDEQFRNR